MPPYNPNFAPGGGASPQGIPTGLPDYASIKSNFEAELNLGLSLRTLQWLFPIPFHMDVPVGGDSDTIDIKQDAHFECFFITGGYSTLDLIGDDPPVLTDVGYNGLSVQITDGSNDLKLMNAHIPCNLFLSPGRQLSPGVTGSPSLALFYPFPFYHLFPANGGIQIDVANAFQAENTLDLLFWGRKKRARIGDAGET